MVPKCPSSDITVYLLRTSLLLYPPIHSDFQPLSFVLSLISFHPIPSYVSPPNNSSKMSFHHVTPLFHNLWPLPLVYDKGSQTVLFRGSSVNSERGWGPVPGAPRCETGRLNSNHSSVHTHHLPLLPQQFTFVGLAFLIYLCIVWYIPCDISFEEIFLLRSMCVCVCMCPLEHKCHKDRNFYMSHTFVLDPMYPKGLQQLVDAQICVG